MTTKDRARVAVAALLTTFTLGVPSPGAGEVRGSVELPEANALVKAYAAHVVERQPRDVRRAWKSQLDRVRLNEHGLWGILGIDGRIVIEYLPDSKTLDCLSPIHSFRGVVRPWVFRALREAAAAGVSTNGTELIYDPVSTAIFVRETFVESPVRKKDFIEICDRVVKTGDRWTREHFLPALNAYYARNAPPASATGRADGLRATLVLAEDEAAFQDVWDRPPTAREPAVWTLDPVRRGERMFAFVLFSGCAEGPDGRCLIEGAFEILGPDGSSVAVVPSFTVWQGPPPPASHLQMSQNSLELGFDEEQTLGSHRLRGEVCDRSAARCVELSLPFELVAARP